MAHKTIEKNFWKPCSHLFMFTVPNQRSKDEWSLTLKQLQIKIKLKPSSREILVYNLFEICFNKSYSLCQCIERKHLNANISKNRGFLFSEFWPPSELHYVKLYSHHYCLHVIKNYIFLINIINMSLTFLSSCKLVIYIVLYIY